MPFTMDWYIKDQVLLANVYGMDSNDLAARIVSMLDDNPVSIHVIVDDDQLFYSPQQLAQLNMTLRMARHPKLKSFIAVGNPFGGAAFFEQILAQIYRVDFTRVPSLGAAIDHLRVRDITIDWDQLLKTTPAAC